MKAVTWFVVLMVMGTVAGCAAKQPAASATQSDAPMKPLRLPPSAQQAQAGAPTDLAAPSAAAPAPAAPRAEPKKAAVVPNDNPIPPKDARFTILCQNVPGPDHVAQSRALKDQLVQATGWRDWHLLHKDGESLLFYGFYPAFQQPGDPKEIARAQKDRQKIDQLEDTMGDRPFRHAIFVELAAPDPAAPPEWNLTSAVPEAEYSLQIAAYKDHPARKEAAVEAVRAARAQGIEAYYYHGETVSSVCIGTWPASAVKIEDEAIATSTDPGQGLLVLPSPIANAPETVRTKEGDQLRTVAPQMKILDKSLEATMRQYREHAINGEYEMVQRRDPVTGQMKQELAPGYSSFLIRIPRAGDETLAGGAGGTPAELDPSLLAPRTGAGTSRLRGIGK